MTDDTSSSGSSERDGERSGAEQADYGNVVALTDARRRAKKPGEPKKSGVMDTILPYVDSLLKLPSRDFDLTAEFATVEWEGRTRFLYEIKPGSVVRPVSKDGIANVLMHHSKHTPGYKPLDPDHAVKAVRFWQGATDSLPAHDISAVRTLTEPGYCWHRLPFDLEKKPTPYFDEMFSRISNAAAIKQWIGALLDPKAERQNYVWIYGDGGQGKGALSRFLAKIFGPSYKAENPPSKEDKFWTFSLIGARLVVFNDCNNISFPATGLCKSLTGGDPIRVEEKGGKVGTAELVCMLMFLSNKKPAVSSENADTRRIIFGEIQPLAAGTKKLPQAKYDQILWNEGAGFLHECRRTYEEMSRGDESYALDAQVLADLVGENEMSLQSFFDTYFEIKEPVMVSGARDVEKNQPHVTAKDMQAVLKTAGKWGNRWQQDPFLSWMRRRYGLQSKVVILANRDVERRYVGVVLSRTGRNVAGGEEDGLREF